MTYAGLAACFLAGALLVLAAAVVVRRPGRAWWAATGLTVVVLLVLTVVFDSLMILADVFRYGDGAQPAFLLWKAPVEDLAWPLAAALGLPAAWLLAGPDESGPDESGPGGR